ncbi:MAG: proton-conducting transporter membrane subunit [Halieaceae bacterium]|jgi:formate hydrogenlyase subunit 3/multisubunit Na+/H+ antiporter MnhD subunit|nr:proton-conducting transporter membrane subunit [Halieaceae bacterium]
MAMAAWSLDMPWSAVLIMLPLAAAMLGFVFPGRAKVLGLATSVLVVFAVVGLGYRIYLHGALQHSIGGWGAPLGIELYADGLSLAMLAITALLGLAVSVYSTAYFDRRQATRFWPLWMFLLAALNALFLSADIFNLYVTLELMGLSAVALVAQAGYREALTGAMRYLLAALLGSLLYLLGVALLYQGFGTLDLAMLEARVTPVPVVWAALGAVTVGMLLKTALFPLHFWLPSAHTAAPSPVSALLSGLVVKASFYILVRYWVGVFGDLDTAVDTMLGLLGAIAVVWGSLQALRQQRLKLLVAYSTVAQIGYLFLAFPLVAAGATMAWQAVVYLALSHALAKGGLFLAVGNLQRFEGHDRILDFDRVVQRLPLTAGAIALAGASIMGLPPSGGFIGKWLLLEAALLQQRWDLVMVILLGGLLAAAYIFKILGYAFTPASGPQPTHSVPRRMEWAALSLGFAAVVMGFLAMPVLILLGIGAPFDSGWSGP